MLPTEQILDFTNIDRLCNTVDLSMDRPVIDLSDATFIEPFALIYLGMFINYHNSQGKYFRVGVPESDKVRGYLTSQRFWPRHHIRLENDDIADQRSLFEELDYSSELNSFNDIIYIPDDRYMAESIGRRVYQLLKNTSVDAQLTVEIVEELVDNFVRHAEAETAACVVQRYPDKGRLDFAIGDRGIGIRSSVSQNPEYSHVASESHRTAAVLAFEPQVGRRSAVEGGMGLWTVRENVIAMEGSLFLSTGDGWVDLREDKATSGEQHYDLPGVQIEVSIPLR